MTTYVNASCQCELNAFRVGFDTASLPIINDICHCSTCRHTSGQMAGQYVAIKGVPLQRINGLSVHSSRSPSRMGMRDDVDSDSAPHRVSHHGNIVKAPVANGLLAVPSITVELAETPYELGDLTAYKSSPNVTRYFCKSCSAHIFWVLHKSDGDIWTVTVGMLDRIAGIVKPGHHEWVGDTVDGGLADQLRVVDGLKLPRYKERQGTEELPFPWRAPEYAPSNPDKVGESQADERLEGFCHCGAISFEITRPSEASSSPMAAYPDLIYPYGGTRLSKINNINDDKWWLRPFSSSHPTKYLAGHCMCTFCRFTGGCEIQSWAFIPLANIVQPKTTTPLCFEHESKRPRGLKQYLASPGEYTEFCGVCGATAFSWQAGTTDLVHVAVGLLKETKEGARAEGWLEWHTKRVSYVERALDTAVARGLEEGLKTVAL